MKGLIAAVVLLISSSAATAAESPTPMLMVGDMSCGSWSSSSSGQRDQYIGWVSGFVSGVNYSDPQHQIPLERLPSQATLILYLNHYCTNNPLNTVAGASFQLLKELRP